MDELKKKTSFKKKKVLKKSSADDLTPWGNLPHPYKSTTTGPKARYARGKKGKK